MVNKLLVILVFYITNMLHFPTSIGIPGLNPLNILTILILFVWLSTRDKSLAIPKAPLGGVIKRFWFISTFALIIGIVNDVVSFSIHDIVFYKNHLFYMSLYFLFYYLVDDKKDARVIIAAVMFTTIIAGLETTKEAFDKGATGYSTTARVSGPFGEGFASANTAGIYFAQYIPLIAVSIYYEKAKLIRLLLSAGLFFSVFGLFSTYSRKALYALGLSMGIVSSKLSKLMFIILIVSLVLFPLWAPQSVVERLDTTSQVSDYDGEEHLDESTESRFILWEGAWKMIQDYPLGVGLERFKHHIGDYSIYSNKDAHNYYVLVTAEMGFIGLFIYLLMLLAFMKETLWLFRNANDDFERTVSLGFFGCLISMIIVNTFGSAFNFGNMMANFWVILGVLSKLKVMNIERSKPLENKE